MFDFTLLMGQGLQELSAHGAFLTTSNGAAVNTMTISWGFVGFMWEKPHFITVVRPQRYTKEILDNGGASFTVSIPFGNALKEALSICGSKSGREIDKSTVVHFIPGRSVTTPVVDGCGLYYECRTSHSQQLDGKLLPGEIKQMYYTNDYHFMYFGEITDCYRELKRCAD